MLHQSHQHTVKSADAELYAGLKYYTLSFCLRDDESLHVAEVILEAVTLAEFSQFLPF